MEGLKGKEEGKKRITEKGKKHETKREEGSERI